MASDARVGRPRALTDALADELLTRIAQGESVRDICADDHMPAESTVYLSLLNDSELSERYARARAIQMDVWSDDIVDIADDGSNDTYTDDEGNERTNHDVIARSKLRVDTRKWLMSKLAPKKYGDKVTQEVTGKDGGPVQIQRIERVIVDPQNPDSAGVSAAAETEQV